MEGLIFGILRYSCPRANCDYNTCTSSMAVLLTLGCRTLSNLSNIILVSDL